MMVRLLTSPQAAEAFSARTVLLVEGISDQAIAFSGKTKALHLQGFVDGRYWARTSDPQLV
jgi:hypothetical protein